MKKPTQAELLTAIETQRGNMSAVARSLRRPRSTVKDWIEAKPELMKAMDDARETRVDVAEAVVYKAAAVENNLSAAFYILNNDPKARSRGWGVQRYEVSGPEGGAIEHKNTVQGKIDVSADAPFVASVLGILSAANALGVGSGAGDESAATSDAE